MLKDKTTTSKSAERLIEEEKGLLGLRVVVDKGVDLIKKYIIETNAKNETLKELELSRKESIERIEKIYEKTNSYLVMKRLIDVASEINEKYHYAVEEVENTYSLNLPLEEKLGVFEEITSITKSYYKMIVDDVEKLKITTS